MSDRDMLIELLTGHYMNTISDVTDVADYLLANDVVKVVRCKDCEHYKPQTQSAHWKNITNYCCRTVSIKMKPNDYCSYGELKECEGK